MEENRPNPDELLKEIAETEKKENRGKLKIFFGYAAGVGKTCAMLDAAHTAKKAGVDVVAGYIEPHARPETIALLNGLEVIDPLRVSYKGITLHEFDLDGALKRRPELILVDELAHTNAAGLRHTKRYADIEELLNAGIHVYTTVNVQHIESLNDIVAAVTHIVVKERIPDSIFDNADQVELVDIEPDDLIDRLNEGKIYRQGQARQALGNFFMRENLVALREIALRRTADRVNLKMEQEKGKGAACAYTGEHILVCLGASPSNAKVIRNAARMVKAFHASFTALYVEPPLSKKMTGENKTRLESNIKLAEQLGAKIVTVFGEDVPYQISEYARLSGVSKIVIGRSNNKGSLFHTRPNFIEKLTAYAPNLDVYIIPDALPKYKNRPQRKQNNIDLNAVDFLKTVLIISLCTLIGLLFYRLGISEANIITIYILGVLLVSSQTAGRLYGILSSVAGVLTYNYFFTEPRFTFRATGAEYPITFLVMLIAAVITSTLTIKVKTQSKETAMKAYRTEILLATNQSLQRAKNIHEIVEVFSGQLIKLLNKKVAVYLSDGRGLLNPSIFYPAHMEHDSSEACMREDEMAVAQWVLKNNRPAGVSTDTLPGAKAFYVPVESNGTVFAVTGIELSLQDKLSPFEQSLLFAMVMETGAAIDRLRLNESRERAKMEAEKERLRANLLRAISHDLRTPLTSISGNAGILMTGEKSFDDATRHKLYEDIYDDSMWLINLVENLLSVTRIENGTMNIHMHPELADEIVSEAMKHINRRKDQYKISVQAEDDLLMVLADPRLIVQVIINIVDNAIKYTNPGSKIILSYFRQKEEVVFEIADNGSGIANEDKERLFDMFYTANNQSGDNRRGLGLGLSLCKSIVNAHGGSIYVRDNSPKGTVFGFTLKYEEVLTHE